MSSALWVTVMTELDTPFLQRSTNIRITVTMIVKTVATDSPRSSVKDRINVSGKARIAVLIVKMYHET